MGGAFVAKFGGPKTSKFQTTSWLDREYLRNVTRNRQSGNGVANYGHSRTGKLNLVHFGPENGEKQDRSSDPPKGADIRLDIAMLLVTFKMRHCHYKHDKKINVQLIRHTSTKTPKQHVHITWYCNFMSYRIC